MRKTLSLVLAAAMLSTTIAACGSSNTTAATTAAAAAETTAAAAETTAAAEESADASATQDFAGQTLTISTFSFNAELLQKNVYDPFMEQTGAKIVVETGKNAERVTKIEESPENYDVVIIGDSFAAQLANDGILESIDRSKITNLDSIYDVAKAPMGEEYGPAYTFNRLGIVYDPAMIDVEIKSFADLWNPELKDCIAVPDLTTTCCSTMQPPLPSV